MVQRYNLLACLVALSFILTPFGCAAKVPTTPNVFGTFSVDFQDSEIKCNAALEGEITISSVQEVINQLSNLPARFPGQYAVLCLNSAGGDVLAASAFMRFMTSSLAGLNGIVTYVPEGATCGSACALILLSGFSCSPRFCDIQRFMHVRSNVWFHSPFLPVRGGKMPPEIAARAFSNGIESIRAFLDPLTEQQWVDRNVETRLTAEMLAIILSKTGNDVYHISTINDAMIFKINVIGTFVVPPVTLGSVNNACNNARVFYSTFSNLGMPEVDSIKYSLHENLRIYKDSPYWLPSWFRCDLFNLTDSSYNLTLGDWGAISIGDESPTLDDKMVSIDEFLESVAAAISPEHAWLFHSGETRLSDLDIQTRIEAPSNIDDQSMEKLNANPGVRERLDSAVASVVTYRLKPVVSAEQQIARSGPGTAYEPVFNHSSGIVVKECEEHEFHHQDYWCLIEENDQAGWVLFSSIEPDVLLSVDGLLVLAPESTYRVKSDVADGYYNVRSGPDIMYPVVFTIPRVEGGISIQNCLFESADSRGYVWCFVTWNERQGWIWSGGIEIED